MACLDLAAVAVEDNVEVTSGFKTGVGNFSVDVEGLVGGSAYRSVESSSTEVERRSLTNLDIVDEREGHILRYCGDLELDVLAYIILKREAYKIPLVLLEVLVVNGAEENLLTVNKDGNLISVGIFGAYLEHTECEFRMLAVDDVDAACVKVSFDADVRCAAAEILAVTVGRSDTFN